MQAPVETRVFVFFAKPQAAERIFRGAAGWGSHWVRVSVRADGSYTVGMNHDGTIRRAIYSGSFDPVTRGHLDVIDRGRRIFDELVVAIGRNISKRELFTLAERRAMVESLVKDMELPDGQGAGSVRVATYQGLTVDYARSIGATVILRGIRNITDLAHECQLALTNRQVADIETVFVVTDQAFSYTSSSLIKQIAALGGDLQRLNAIVPPNVIQALAQLKATRGFDWLIEDHME